ncbi:uncharacterized protein LOC119597812 [Penaeus monodon]|uniref:uncharacterized protein LOC119597812 n=1 Tax=Penaeus monodon TaxID=6687 RepID=UPI0018A704EB|nr:uncharacterized protein LOC119597812 [Penaeus monodon]
MLSPLKTLKNDKTILITKPDKGRGVVILSSCDYKQKILYILSDHTKFKRIITEVSTHLLYLEDKLKRLLRIIKTSVNESTYNFLMNSGSRPGLLYGLPKVHKPNIPLRPIISSIGNFNYNTAKFLVPIISPLTINQYTIENSTTFVNEITSLTFQQPITMRNERNRLEEELPPPTKMKQHLGGCFRGMSKRVPSNDVHKQGADPPGQGF